MNANANANSHPNKAQRTPTLAVAPVTRAIRTALAISATLLALGGSGAAFAQTCVATSSSVETCEGAFTGTVPGTFFTPVADLTLVLGDSANGVPTSVTPAAGLMGIDAEWGGNVGVTSYADITTTGASGIFAYGSTSASVSNNGSITTDVTAPGAKAMDISAYGSVSVVNNGAINAHGADAYDVTAVSASSLFGNISVTNLAAGTITATAQDGNAIAIDASANSTDFIVNYGAITASSVNGIAIGVLDQSSTARSSLFNYSGITVSSTNGQAVGALVSGAEAYVNNLSNAYRGLAGAISVTSGADAAIGIEAYAYHSATVKNSASIAVTSNGGTATGIIADAYKGAARVTNTGNISATALYYNPAVGVEAYSAFSGAASVSNSGSIAATAVSGSATGIVAQAHYGQVGVVNSGDVSAVSSGAGTYYQHNKAIGIVASSGAGYSPGITHVTNSGNISASGPTLGEGIVGSARYGDLTITNTATGTITAYGQDEAIGIGTGQNSHNGFGRYYDFYTSQANIYNAGSITATANGAHCGSCRVNATGIQVFLNDGNNITVTNSGDIAVSALGTSTNQFDDAVGIDTVTYRGNITVNNSGNISVINNTADTLADYSIGILTNTAFGDTSIVNSGNINVSASATMAEYDEFGIWAKTAGGGTGAPGSSDGAISVVNSGNINVTSPDRSGVVYGISVGSFTQFGKGLVSVINSGDINLSTGSTAQYGIELYSMGIGSVVASNSGSITTNDLSMANGNGGIGMGMLVKFNGAGADPGTATITNSGDISASAGARAVGIYARADERSNYFPTANLTVNNSGSISASAIAIGGVSSPYVNAYGIRTRNTQGTTMLTNSGSIMATVSEDPVGVAYPGASVTGVRVSDYTFAQTPEEIKALSPGYGDISITNTGSIMASITSNVLVYSNHDIADGVDVRHGYGTVNVGNAGLIAAIAQDDATTVAGGRSPSPQAVLRSPRPISRRRWYTPRAARQ